MITSWNGDQRTIQSYFYTNFNYVFGLFEKKRSRSFFNVLNDIFDKENYKRLDIFLNKATLQIHIEFRYVI